MPFNLASRLGDRTVTLSWEVDDPGAVASFRVHRSDNDGSSFAVIDSTSSSSSVLTGLPLNRPVLLRVTSLTSTGIESRPSGAIYVTAGLLRILIESGDEYTLTRDVSVEISSPVPVTYVELSESSDFVGAIAREFSASMSFELSQADGLKTVYARLTFADGGEPGEALSDDIILDTQANIDSVWFTPRNVTFEAGDTVFFYLRAHGEIGGGAQVSFPGITGVLLMDTGAGGDQNASDGIYSARWIVPVGLGVADGEVSGSFADAAGNNAPPAQALQLLNIRTATIPTPVVLAVGLTDSTTAHLSWSENEDEDFASYRVYRSVSPGIDVGDDFLMIAIITNQTTTTHEDYLSGGGTYYYRVFVFDTEDLTAGSNEVVITR